MELKSNNLHKPSFLSEPFPPAPFCVCEVVLKELSNCFNEEAVEERLLIVSASGFFQVHPCPCLLKSQTFLPTFK